MLNKNKITIVDILEEMQQIVFFLNILSEVGQEEQEAALAKTSAKNITRFLKIAASSIALELTENKNLTSLSIDENAISSLKIAQKDTSKLLNASDNPNIPEIQKNINKAIDFFSNLDDAKLPIKNDEIYSLKAKAFAATGWS